MSIKIKERRDGRAGARQAVFYALRPGKVKAERIRLNVPPSVTSHSGAVRWAESVRREIEQGRDPPQTRASRKQAPAPSPPEALTVREWVEQYLDDAEARRVRPTTIKLWRRCWAPHLLLVAGDRLVSDFSELDWQRLRRGLAHMKPSTANRIMAFVTHLLTLAMRAGLRGPVPEPARIRGSEINEIPESYSVTEYEQIVSAAREKGPSYLAAVLLGGDAGLRRGEIAGLRVEDVEGGVLYVRRTIVRVDGQRCEHPPKNSRVRRVPGTPRLLEQLRELTEASPDGWLVRTRQGEPATADSVANLVRSVLLYLRMPSDGPHKLRHTFASQAIEAGASLREVQELLGHGSVMMTARYLHTDERNLRSAVERLSRHRSGDTAVTQAEVVDISTAASNRKH